MNNVNPPHGNAVNNREELQPGNTYIVMIQGNPANLNNNDDHERWYKGICNNNDEAFTLNEKYENGQWEQLNNTIVVQYENIAGIYRLNNNGGARKSKAKRKSRKTRKGKRSYRTRK